jgi:hypothetical protein
VHGDNYHVFLTPKGDSKGWLYVSKQNPNGFTVQEAAGGTSNIGFSYRIVAKRKDIPGTRLEHVDVPALPQVPSKPVPPAIAPASPPTLPSSTSELRGLANAGARKRATTSPVSALFAFGVQVE